MPEPSADAVVGRESELQAVREVLDRMATGPGALMIEGEPGIGKTAVWNRAMRFARDRGYLVLTSTPTPSETPWSFCGLGDLLTESTERVAAVLPTAQRRAIEAALFPSDADPRPHPLAISVAVLAVLRSLAADAPVLVGIDDVQWLDEPTAAALQFALRRLNEESVGLVCVAWPSGGALAPVFERPGSRRLRLGPLSEDEMGRLLDLNFGTASVRVRASDIHRLSGGNPLYALEIGRAITEGRAGVEPGAPLPIPHSLRHLVEERLRALPGPAREVALIAAASSEPTVAVVEAAMGSGTETDRAIESALRSGVIAIDAGRIHFSHPILGSVLLDSTAPGLLRDIHGRLSQTVSDPEERAKHLARSVVQPDPAVAAVLEEAAGTSRQRGAPRAAAELSEAAARLTPPSEAADAARRKAVAAEYYLDAGNTSRSRALLEEALSALSPGPIRAAALQRLGWVRYREAGWKVAAPLFDEALRETRDEGPLRAAIELDRSLALLFSGDYGGAASAAREAIERARALGDPSLESRGAALLSSVDFLMGKGISDEMMDRALGQETWARGGPTFEHASVAFGVVLKIAGDLAVARKRLEFAHREVLRRGDERSLPFLLFHLAELECWSGNLATAERHARDANDVAFRTGQEATRAFTLYSLALVAAHRGRVEEARATGREALEVSGRTGALAARTPVLSVFGFLEVSLGNMADALRWLAPLAEGVVVTGVQEPGTIRWFGDAVEAYAACGRLDPARELIGPVERRARDLDRAWVLAIASRSRGLVHAAAGNLEEAERTLSRAAVDTESLGQPMELGRTLLAAGTVKRRLKRRRSARGDLERALAIFDGMGAPLWADRTRQELVRIAGRVPAPPTLTPTELQVGRAVAEGATNEEVARALFMSPKTVEWHLSRIYRKAGVRSRTELARWLRES